MNKRKGKYNSAINALIIGLTIATYTLTAISALGVVVNPAKTAIPALLYMFFPLFILLTIIIVIVNIFRHKTLAYAGLLLIVACLTPLLHNCPLNFKRMGKNETPQAGQLSVMTFNAYYFKSHAGSNLDSLGAAQSAEAIINLNPDIVVFQEIPTFDIFDERRANIPDSLTLLIRTIYPYRIATTDAIGIISKYPVEQVPITYPDIDYTFRVNRYDVHLPDTTTLHIFNVHLQSVLLSSSELGLIGRKSLKTEPEQLISTARGDIWPKLSAAFIKRAQQAEVVHELIQATIQQPTLVCGDFNDVPWCYAMRTIAGNNLTDVYAAAGLGLGYTYRNHHLYFNIDHMLCSKSLTPLGAHIVHEGGSDHYPMLAFFSVKK